MVQDGESGELSCYECSFIKVGEQVWARAAMICTRLLASGKLVAARHATMAVLAFDKVHQRHDTTQHHLHQRRGRGALGSYPSISGGRGFLPCIKVCLAAEVMGQPSCTSCTALIMSDVLLTHGSCNKAGSISGLQRLFNRHKSLRNILAIKKRPLIEILKAEVTLVDARQDTVHPYTWLHEVTPNSSQTTVGPRSDSMQSQDLHVPHHWYRDAPEDCNC
jgi:hypothetical protein